MSLISDINGSLVTVLKSIWKLDPKQNGVFLYNKDFCYESSPWSSPISRNCCCWRQTPLNDMCMWVALFQNRWQGDTTASLKHSEIHLTSPFYTALETKHRKPPSSHALTLIRAHMLTHGTVNSRPSERGHAQAAPSSSSHLHDSEALFPKIQPSLHVSSSLLAVTLARFPPRCQPTVFRWWCYFTIDKQGPAGVRNRYARAFNHKCQSCFKICTLY